MPTKPKSQRIPRAKLLATPPRLRPHGGTYYNTRLGRGSRRPLSNHNSMHLILRSSLATGSWVLNKAKTRARIEAIAKACAVKYGVQIHKMAVNVNHLHFHIKLRDLRLYLGFIRSLTAKIAMAVTGWVRGNPKPKGQRRFWDLRPFTRLVQGLQQFTRLQNYIEINQLEGCGLSRAEARFEAAWYRATRPENSS